MSSPTASREQTGPAGRPTPDRILIVRPSALGDVCRTVPILVSLKRAYPRARVDWVVQDSFAAAIEHHPDLHEVIGFPRARFANWWRSAAGLRDVLDWSRTLRVRRYDLVLDCQGLGRSALITWSTRAPVRVGHRDAREFGWISYTHRHAGDPTAHTVDRMLELVQAIDVEPVRDMRLYASDDAIQWWDAQRDDWSGADRNSYAVLAPTSRWASKRWPAAHWSVLVRGMCDKGITPVIIAAPNEMEQVAEIDMPGAINLSGRTTIAQTMAVIRSADLLVANDSAPLHMAVGFGRPVIGLFGPTDPARVGPYADDAVVLRGGEAGAPSRANFKSSRLGDRLMRLIEPDHVMQHIVELLVRTGRIE